MTDDGSGFEDLTLDERIDLLTEVCATEPDDPDRFGWYVTLGLLHAERAWAGVLDDHDRAVTWFARALAGLPDDDPDRDDVTAALAESAWDRFFARRYGRPCDDDTARAEATLLVTELAGLAVDPEYPGAGYLRMLAGLGLLARYDETGHRPDLDAGIATLAETVPGLPPDTPWHDYAAAELTYGYFERAVADADADTASLDLSVETGEWAAGAAGPEPSPWSMLPRYRAFGYQARWELAGDPADLDRAVLLWRGVLDADPDPGAAGCCGDLLRQRAEAAAGGPDTAAVDLDEAVRLLERATAEATFGASGYWYDLGRAHRARWRLAGTRDSLDAAADCLDRALDLAADRDRPDGDRLLAIHCERLTTGWDAVSHDSDQAHTATPPSAERLDRYLTAGREALASPAAAGADPEVRAILAGLLGCCELQLGGLYQFDAVDLDRVHALLAHGRAASPSPKWPALLDLYEGQARYLAGQRRLDEDAGDGGIQEMIRAATSAHLDEADQQDLRHTLSIALYARATAHADVRGMRAAHRMVKARFAGASDGGPAPELKVVAALMTASEQGLSGDATELGEILDRAAEALARLPRSPNTARVEAMMRNMRQLVALQCGEPVDPGPLPPVEVPSGPQATMTLATQLLTHAAHVAVAAVHHDLPLLRRCARQIEQLAGHVPPGHNIRLMATTLGGHAEREVARRDRVDAAAARRGAGWYAEAMELAGGPGHPLWANLAIGRADCLRLARDPDQAGTRAIGRSALDAHGWRVLQQAGTDFAISSARSAAADARTVAGWCLEDRAYDELVAVLDAGRGLVLHSATVSRDVADLLSDAGHHELAAEWRETGGLGRDQLTGDAMGADAPDGPEIPDGLRLRVLRALRTGGRGVPAVGPLAPVRLAEIREALAAVTADALVYLVPAAPGSPGAAVVVPADGPVEAITLPGLVTGPGSVLHRYTGGGTGEGGRDAGPVGGDWDDAGPAGGDWDDTGPVGGGWDDVGPGRADLDELCRWAWSAAMRDLTGHVHRWRLPHPARLVLVPTGPLALVPWHAAYAEVGRGRRRYAVQDLAISYSVSARMLCVAPGRPVPARTGGAALVVGDPGGDLAFAGVEARAVRRRFYPDGSYFGRPADAADAAGTPGEVLAWIAAAGPGPSTLHFACHGRVDPARPADAHLVLAGGTLTARRILEASRDAALVIDRVFLAACTTNVSGTDYDEAFSLATTFLAAGARTVFGSLWPVPDVDTSLLMYLVHHHLAVDGCPPAEALRRAQLWMLDPERQPPAGLPAELLPYCGGPRPADPVCWAGFTHLGR